MPVNLRRKVIRAGIPVLKQAYHNVKNVAKGKGKSNPALLKPLKKPQVQQVKSKNVVKEEPKRVEEQSTEMKPTVSTTKENIEQIDDIIMLSPADVPLPDSSLEDASMEDETEVMNQKNLEKDKETEKEMSSSEKLDVKEKEALIQSVDSLKMEEDGVEPIEEDMIDIDEENKDDPNQSPQYAFEIFQYLKFREAEFKVKPYFQQQKELTPHMRSILMDWMVEVQENFELNHETLYLAVKLVDLYLMEVQINKDTLQLLGASAMFISAKFDERCPPALEDFIFICDDAYDRGQFIKMEKDILKCIDYDLGMPLSYRFLRRYAKCVHASMETLTLGRFILELSLMEPEFIVTSESKLAAAALLLAFMMKSSGKWDATLEHFSGYKSSELAQLVQRLNAMLVKPAHKQLTTVRTKYSHKVFYEVANIPPLEVLTL
ncbi:cyclin B3 [Apostichopus japonicus]|uniref:Cyclin B3 n=1 Tax=Stichopus japonicus TaxID=307972 RepID=A0A2G8KXI0_STIJA|nr:cyclin B3 [Apostichopus japonicus]